MFPQDPVEFILLSANVKTIESAETSPHRRRSKAQGGVYYACSNVQNTLSDGDS